MFYIISCLISWIIWILFADKKRWRELFLVGIFASLLGSVTDVIMHHYMLWGYPANKSLLPLLLDDISVYIIIPYLFIQWLPSQRTLLSMLCYWFCWTLVTIGIEEIYQVTGHMKYYKWWNIWCSYLSDWFLFWLFYKFHKLFRLRLISSRQLS